MSNPLARKGRQTGRHTTGPNTVPDVAEEVMTAPVQPRKPALPEVLEDLLTMHEQAMHRVREAKGSIPAIEEKIRTIVRTGDDLRAQAAEKRREAAELDLRADSQFAAATELGEQRDGLREEAATHQARADYHGARIDEEIRLGAEDPQARRDRLAKEKAAKAALQAAQAAQSQQGFPSPSPLDAPSGVHLQTMTAPIPVEPGPDQVQQTPAGGVS